MVYAMYEDGSSLPRRRLSAFFWALFAIGLLLQAFGPHLKIKDNQFVVPPSMIAAGTEIRPAELIERERRIQLLSGALTLGGAIGLALCYGKVLFGTRSARSDFDSGSHAASNDSRIVK
jgi:hypothetical protein